MTVNSLGNHAVSADEEKERLQWGKGCDRDLSAGCGAASRVRLLCRLVAVLIDEAGEW